MKIFNIKYYNSNTVYENESCSKEPVNIQIKCLNGKKCKVNLAYSSLFFCKSEKRLTNEESFAAADECGPHAIFRLRQNMAWKRITPPYIRQPD
jgi:hypothetical protein